MTTLPMTGAGVFPAAGMRQEPQAPAVRCRTPRSILLAIYAVIPISALIVLLDYACFGGYLKAHLPRSPEDLFLFLIFFNMPHIISSTVIFCDTEYLKHYGKLLLPPALILAGIALFYPAALYSKAFMFFYAGWAILHFTGQQAGMARAMGPLSKRLYLLWRWGVLFISVPVNLAMFQMVPMTRETHQLLLVGVGVALAGFVAVSLLLCRSAETKLGRYYILANAAGMVAGVGMFTMGYYFFVIMITRVIHDLSAYTFYISHDTNRNAEGARNFVYRGLGFLRIPPYLLSPLVGMAVAFPFTYYLHEDWAFRIWLPITLMHYYTDGMVWKKGSLHREHVHMR